MSAAIRGERATVPIERCRLARGSMRWVMWIAAGTSYLACAAAFAAEPASQSALAQCSSRTSERVTVRQVATDLAKYQGHCVTIDAVMQELSLFDDVDGVYLKPKDLLDPSSNGARIGLGNLGRHASERYRHVSVWGRVGDCQAIRDCVDAAFPDAVVFVTGYCHSYNGAILSVEGLKFRKGPPFERRMGSFGRQGYGDLQPAPADWPHRDFIAGLADKFISALRTGDGTELANIHYRNVGLQWVDEEEALLRFLLRDRKSPFADIRTSATPPQRQILVQRPWRDPEESDDVTEDDDYSSTVCFCREPDCTGRWPIAQRDADNVRDRPYACTEIAPYLDEGTWLVHFATPVGGEGLREPSAAQ